MHPVLVSIPHASLFVPQDLQGELLISETDIANHADLYTDEIFKVSNATVVEADISRIILDVNRAPDDIEAECKLCVAGVVVRTTPDGKKVYKNPPSLEILEERIAQYHTPYHDLIDDMVEQKGIRFLIDGHSMWSHGPSALQDAGTERADIVLGNRDYTTCTRSETYFIKHFFEQKGWKVEINKPYKGKYILGYHCHRKRLPGIQIEINRKLFLDEKTLERKTEKISSFQSVIEELIEVFSEKYLQG